jgi:hypothetical protein
LIYHVIYFFVTNLSILKGKALQKLSHTML